MINLNGKACLSVDLTLPRSGVWVADVVIASSEGMTVGDAVVLTVDSFTFSGTIYAKNVGMVGRDNLRIIGGRGKMTTTIEARDYAIGPTLQVVAKDMLLRAGEELNVTASDSTVLATSLRTWQCINDVSVGEQITRLLKSRGAVWRVEYATGKIVFLKDTFTQDAVLPTNSVIIGTTTTGTTYKIPLLDKLVDVGTVNVQGRRYNIEEVRLSVDSKQTTLSLNHSRLNDLFAVTGQRIDNRYLRKYHCTIIKQNADGSLRLDPDDVTIKGHSIDNVPIRSIPGVTHLLDNTKKVRCVLSYEDADPNRPIVESFEAYGTSPGLDYSTLGNTSTAQFLALSNKVDDNFAAIKDYLDKLKLFLDAHYHPTGVGPSGPPTTVPPLDPSPPSPALTPCKRIKSE